MAIEFFIFLLVFALIGTLIGAIILRAAIGLYNALVGGGDSPSAVPKPPLGRAIFITFVFMVANLFVSAFVGAIIGSAAAAAGTGQGGANFTAQIISLPMSLLVMAGMLTALLPTTFGRGLLVVLIYMLISAVIMGMFSIIVFVAGGSQFG
jgi:hypothetical protein